MLKGKMTWLTLKLPDKLQPYGLYVVHICDFGMFRVKGEVQEWVRERIGNKMVG